MAEIFSRYYPAELALHSFDPAATNAARKRDAWELILKFTRVRDPHSPLATARRCPCLAAL